MDRSHAERVTSPALALAAVASAILIVFDPARAVLWIVPAPVVAAIGCVLGARLSLQFRPRAVAAAIVFSVEALAWVAAAAYLLAIHLGRAA